MVAIVRGVYAFKVILVKAGMWLEVIEVPSLSRLQNQSGYSERAWTSFSQLYLETMSPWMG